MAQVSVSCIITMIRAPAVQLGEGSQYSEPQIEGKLSRKCSQEFVVLPLYIIRALKTSYRYCDISVDIFDE